MAAWWVGGVGIFVVTGSLGLDSFLAKYQPARGDDTLRVTSRVCHEAKNGDYNGKPNYSELHLYAE